MKQETIIKAVKVINRSIKFYQRKLTYQLELKAEANLNNGNLKSTNLDDYDSNIEKYGIILSDLATIKRAIRSGKSEVKIYGTSECRWQLYNETSEVIEKAGFDIDGDPDGTIYLCSIEECEEEEELMAFRREVCLRTLELIEADLGI